MGSVISVWDVETGEKIIQYSKVHGDREITSMTFDPSGRRLLTGGRDGKVKIWNFNNGACLSEIDMGDTSEVFCNVILICKYNPIVLLQGLSCISSNSFSIKTWLRKGDSLC